MNKQDAKKRIDELNKLTAYYAAKYYDDDSPEISDFEYDMLMSELKNLAFTAKSKKASILIKNASILTVYECKSIAFINPNYVTFDFS